jgi:hypothetical protein
MFMVANEKIHAKLRKSAQTAKYFAQPPMMMRRGLEAEAPGGAVEVAV